MKFRLGAIFLDVLFPKKCLVCDSFIDKDGQDPIRPRFLDDVIPEHLQESVSSRPIDFHHPLKDGVCDACLAQVIPADSPLCTVCGIVFQSRAIDDHLCGDCLNRPKHYDMARAFGIYDQTLMELVHCFKYRGKSQLARSLGRLLLWTFLRFWREGDVDIIVPVPLHRKRFQHRGFNQAYLLVKDWRLAEYCLPPVERDVLHRQRWTDPQTGLGRKARIRNIKDAFGVSHSFKIRKKNVLLVDDVYTTGATAEECAKALLASGANRVDVLTLARAL